MAAKRASSADLRRVSDRLRALRADPPRQREFAAQLLADGNLGELLAPVLSALGPPFDPAIRPALLARYREMEKSGSRGDPGGSNRARLLSALAPIATWDDLDLFVSATSRMEKSMQEPNGPSALRAAGLAGLEHLDREAATYAAMRLLADRENTLEMTGEPALTAVRVLANLGQDSVLYYHALSAGRFGNSEVLGESLRLLVNLPRAEMESLAARFVDDPDDVKAAGACDLALSSPPTGVTRKILAGVLESPREDLVGYATMAIAALRRAAWMELLYDRAAAEENRVRLEMVIEALKAVPGDPRAQTAREQAEFRITGYAAALMPGKDTLRLERGD